MQSALLFVSETCTHVRLYVLCSFHRRTRRIKYHC